MEEQQRTIFLLPFMGCHSISYVVEEQLSVTLFSPVIELLSIFDVREEQCIPGYALAGIAS